MIRDPKRLHLGDIIFPLLSSEAQKKSNCLANFETHKFTEKAIEAESSLVAC